MSALFLCTIASNKFLKGGKVCCGAWFKGAVQEESEKRQQQKLREKE